MNAKSLLYVGLPIVVLGALYIALKPQRADVPPGTSGPAVVAPAPVAPASSTATSPSTPTAAPAGAPTAAPAAASTAAPAAKEETRVAASPIVFDVVIANGKRTVGPGVFKVHEGDEVTINVTSDKADKLHLHGYDLHGDLTPGKTVTLKFTAKLTGRFPLELHHSDLEIAALEVYPR
jgi:hypothetical protein